MPFRNVLNKPAIRLCYLLLVHQLAVAGLTPGVKYSVGTNMNPRGVVLADFSGDKKLDIAVVNVTGNSVSILLGNGDGTFQSPMSYPTGPSPGDWQQETSTTTETTIWFSRQAVKLRLVFCSGRVTVASKPQKPFP